MRAEKVRLISESQCGIELINLAGYNALIPYFMGHNSRLEMIARTVPLLVVAERMRASNASGGADE